MEQNVTIRAREVDVPIVEELLPEVQKLYTKKTKQLVTLKIDAKEFLPADGCGGVQLFAAQGNFTIIQKI